MHSYIYTYVHTYTTYKYAYAHLQTPKLSWMLFSMQCDVVCRSMCRRIRSKREKNTHTTTTIYTPRDLTRTLCMCRHFDLPTTTKYLWFCCIPEPTERRKKSLVNAIRTVTISFRFKTDCTFWANSKMKPESRRSKREDGVQFWIKE